MAWSWRCDRCGRILRQDGGEAPVVRGDTWCRSCAVEEPFSLAAHVHRGIYRSASIDAPQRQGFHKAAFLRRLSLAAGFATGAVVGHLISAWCRAWWWAAP